MKLGYGFGAFGNRFTATPELHFGLSDAARDLRPLEGRGPCLGQTHRRVVPDAIVGAPAPDREPLDPHLRAPRRAAQIQPVLVEEPRRALGRLNPPYRELAQSRTTIRTSTRAGLPDSGWSLKARPETDKHSFISLIRALDEAGRCLKRVSDGGGGVHKNINKNNILHNSYHKSYHKGESLEWRHLAFSETFLTTGAPSSPPSCARSKTARSPYARGFAGRLI